MRSLRLPLALVCSVALLWGHARLLEGIKVWVYIKEDSLWKYLKVPVLYDDRGRLRLQKVRHAFLQKEDFLPESVLKKKLEGYVHAIRGYSRYLGAFSCYVDPGEIGVIERLPFVEKVDRVRSWVSPERADLRKVSVVRKLEKGEGDTFYGESWTQLEMLKIPSLHRRGYTGRGVRIAVFDTGFRKSHVAFSRFIKEERLIAERDFVYGDGNVQDEPGEDQGQENHGTAVLSLIGGYIPGVLVGAAYDAEFLLAKTEYVASETRVEEDNYIFAIEWADSLGADIITSSLAYRDFEDTTYSFSVLDGRTAPLSIAVNKAFSRGVVVVSAAGNFANYYEDGGLYTPADAFGVITVGAVDSEGRIALFSSHGPTYDGRIKPDVCAIGIGNFVAHGGKDSLFGYGSGTSFATPLIAGSCALILQAHPDWGPADVLNALRLAGNRALSPDNRYGWGIPDIADIVLRMPELEMEVSAGKVVSVPNPTNGFAKLVFGVKGCWFSPEGVVFKIFDLRGREVWRKKVDFYPVCGKFELGWKCVDKRGRSVPSGVYLVGVYKGKECLATGKILIFR